MNEGERRLLDAVYPLGPMEELFRLTAERFGGDGTSALVVRLGGRVQRETLEGALGALVHRHPRLRARIIADARGKHSFEVSDQARSVRLTIKDFPNDDLPWEAEGQACVREPFDLTAAPLLRVLVLRSASGRASELMFTFHHAVADGTSATQAMHEVLTNYQALAGGACLESLLASQQPLPFVPELIPTLTAPLWHRAQTLFRMVRFFGPQTRRGWTDLPNDSPACAARSTRSALSVEDSAALARRCRKERVTGYGAIFAASVSSLADCLGDGRWRFNCGCLIDTRGLPGAVDDIPPEHLGCFIAVLQKIYTVRRPVALWELARAACEDCRGYLRKQGPAMAARLIPGALRSLARLKISQSRPPRRPTLFVNYVPAAGLASQYAGMGVEAFSEVQGNRFSGSSLAVVAFPLQQRINVLVWSVDVGADFCRGFQQRLLGTLEGIARGRL